VAKCTEARVSEAIQPLTLSLLGVGMCMVLFMQQPNRAAARRQSPKNVIVMISDGCGFNHVASAGFFEHGKTGAQPYEAFPVKLAMSTYAEGHEYVPALAWRYFNYVSDAVGCTDSAAAATAMSTGVKTYDAAIGVDIDHRPLRHAIEVAENQGMSTGVVTSVEFSHATPAGFVAHHSNRDAYDAIARQMIYESHLEVIMGCGHPAFDDDGTPIARPRQFRYVGGNTTWEDLSDGRVTGADADRDGTNDDWTVIFARDEFLSLMTGPTPKRVIGIAKKLTTLQQARRPDPNAPPFTVPYNGDVPSLAEMAQAALNVLDDDPDGFFLMIEGGAVDWASHSNQTGRMIEEEIEFNKAVRAVLEWVGKRSNWRQTLLVVTGDHECGYLTGPGSGASDQGPKWNPPVGHGHGQVPDVEWHSKKHTNSLIPFYAQGRDAARFSQAAKNRDPVRGRYIDNTDVGKILRTVLTSRR